MARRHSSFLLRCWGLGSDDERIEIEHIQAGTTVLVRSVADAVEWICAQGDGDTERAVASETHGTGCGSARDRTG